MAQESLPSNVKRFLRSTLSARNSSSLSSKFGRDAYLTCESQVGVLGKGYADTYLDVSDADKEKEMELLL